MTEPWMKHPLILAYHSVSTSRKDGLAVRSEDFDWQMGWLAARGYRSITLSQLLHGEPQPDERVVLITFDDGYADCFTEALPVLRRYGFTATVFLVTDSVGQESVFWWDRHKVAAAGDARLFHPLHWDQVIRMAEAGIEFGSHSCSHPPALTRLPREACWTEIAQSRAVLEEKLGRIVTSFCYPRGDLNDEVVHMVAAAGYECAVVTPPRLDIPISRFTLRRISLYREYGRGLFRLMVTPLFRRNYMAFKRLRRVLAQSWRQPDPAEGR